MSRDDDKRPARSAASVLAAIAEHVAEDEADDPEPTEADRRWAEEECARMQRRIAEMRRQLHPPARSGLAPTLVLSERLREMPRAALLAELAAVNERGVVVYAHQDLTGLTDGDLRYVLAALERSAE